MKPALTLKEQEEFQKLFEYVHKKETKDKEKQPYCDATGIYCNTSNSPLREFMQNVSRGGGGFHSGEGNIVSSQTEYEIAEISQRYCCIH